VYSAVLCARPELECRLAIVQAASLPPVRPIKCELEAAVCPYVSMRVHVLYVCVRPVLPVGVLWLCVEGGGVRVCVRACACTHSLSRVHACLVMVWKTAGCVQGTTLACTKDEFGISFIFLL
jgi:hypothetical protein